MKLDKIVIKSLVNSCTKGDRKAQHTIYEAFYGKMLTVCYRYADNMDEAKDIHQEAFIKIFEKIGKFKNSDSCSLEAWIHKLMVNTSIDYIRKKKITFLNLDGLNNKDELLTTEEFEDFESLRSEQLLKFIQKLPIHYRTAVNLYGIEGYSHKEVGKIMNVPTVTSRSYYFRGRNKLKVMFDNFNKTI